MIDAGGGELASELFFLQTIQTILGEEVANAVHLSRLLDLKNFNAAVLDNVESGVLTVNEAGRITFANRLARGILGLAAEGTLPEETTFAAHFTVPGGVEGRAASADGASWTGEARRLDGSRVPVALRTRRIVDPGDSEPLVVVAFEDLTEQRQLEEQARRADRLRSLGELSAAIAHEVRNPLQGISLTLSNLQEHLAPAGAPYVQVIFGEMERLNAIVGGILSFARPTPPMPVDFELAAVCNRALELAREQAERKSVELELEPLPADDRCEADEGQILQVVLNLVLNGMEAVGSDGEGRRIVVRTRRTDGAVCVAVRDQGAGIPGDNLPRIFETFYTTKPNGMGMGLPISRSIVEAHGGRIWAANDPDRGATVAFTLPACPPEPPAA